MSVGVMVATHSGIVPRIVHTVRAIVDLTPVRPAIVTVNVDIDRAATVGTEWGAGEMVISGLLGRCIQPNKRRHLFNNSSSLPGLSISRRIMLINHK